ncbi:DUF2066 domain-containing protein [Gayadomonas joobiniege]|uniref:DUF2066 domain-containing protein n=1 Tax=Gayadomonas joobiniege TaxID=1234606 RepID=UPI000376E666|nr:DUF2066 domain-containing protein [Gayadomonas joobiniege]
MRFKYSDFFWLVILCLSSTRLAAVEMRDLYNSQISVEGQSYQDRQSAYQSAIKEVLVKVTGDLGIASNPSVADIINQPTQYLHQYSFVTKNNQLLLEARFNETLINQTLQTRGVKLWGTRRPESLWWIVLNDDKNRRIIAYDDKIAAARLTHQAEYRGIPVILPLMDLDDQLAVEMTDIRGRFVSAVASASERYQPEAIVLANVFQDSNAQSEALPTAWIAQMTFSIQDTTIETTLSRGQLSDLWPAMIDWVSDEIARKFSVQSSVGENESIVIHLENLANAAEVVRVQQFFKTLSAVKQVSVKTLSDQGVAFELKLSSAKSTLLNALSLDNKIEKVEYSFGHQGPKVEYLYRWKGQFN